MCVRFYIVICRSWLLPKAAACADTGSWQCPGRICDVGAAVAVWVTIALAALPAVATSAPALCEAACTTQATDPGVQPVE